MSADDEPDEPEVPASFYGTLTIDGDPAESGVVIVAIINGDEQDSIVVEEGTFGGPAADDEKLTVQGYEGDEITFYVEGDALDRTQADQTVELEAFDDQSIDLTVSTGQIGGNGESTDDPATPIPIIDADPGTNITAGDTVTFSAAESSVAQGTLMGYEWSIDGENRSIEDSFTETFTEAGQYEIELVVRSDANKTASTSLTVTVEESVADVPADEETPSEADDDSLPGFGILATLLAVAYGLYRIPQRNT